MDEFKTIHDETHSIVDEVNELCTGLFKLEHGFLGGNYAVDVVGARSAVTTFFDIYAGAIVTFLNHFNSIEASCDLLLQIGGEFLKKNDLTCRSRYFLKGCEAELNELRCELSSFLNDIKIKRDNAIDYVNKMKNVCATLSKSVKQLSSSGQINRCDDFCELLTLINQFFVQFNRNHWIGHVHFVNLQFICDSVTATVSTLSLKYSKYCN